MKKHPSERKRPMPQFLTIQDGSYSINLAHIAAIQWFKADKQDGIEAYAEISVDGEKYCCEGKDYQAIRKIAGLK
jgi:hypothetical protein